MEKLDTLDIVKYGTAVLATTDFDNQKAVDYNVMREHGRVLQSHSGAKQIVSSGAVEFGRISMNGRALDIQDPTTEKRILAEHGQPDLIQAWKNAMPHEKVLQKLVTYHDLQRETLMATMRAAINNKLLYIFNFNDGVDDSELKENEQHQFGDNDSLAAKVTGISTQLASKVRLILNTSADGFSDDGGQSVVEHLDAEQINQAFVDKHCDGTSNGGTGGMGDKLLNAKEAIALGAQEVWIVNGKQPEQLNAVLQGKHAGTLITKQSA